MEYVTCIHNRTPVITLRSIAARLSNAAPRAFIGDDALCSVRQLPPRCAATPSGRYVRVWMFFFSFLPLSEDFKGGSFHRHDYYIVKRGVPNIALTPSSSTMGWKKFQMSMLIFIHFADTLKEYSFIRHFRVLTKQACFLTTSSTRMGMLLQKWFQPFVTSDKLAEKTLTFCCCQSEI